MHEWSSGLVRLELANSRQPSETAGTTKDGRAGLDWRAGTAKIAASV